MDGFLQVLREEWERRCPGDPFPDTENEAMLTLDAMDAVLGRETRDA